MSIFTKIGAWLVKAFSSVKNDADKIAIAITEGVQTALKSGVVLEVAKAIEAIFPGVQHIPEEIVAQLQIWVPKVLVAELAVQGMPDNPTEQDILDFEKRILEAFAVHDQKSKLYTTLAAQIYGILKKYTDPNYTSTWAEKVADVEQAFQDYLADVADEQAGS